MFAATHHDPDAGPVLVAHASKHGSTAEIAEAIAAELGERGLVADVLPAGDVRDVSGYHAVVLGSATYVKHWRREARRFLHRFESELAERPFWVFSSGPIGEPEKSPDDSWVEPKKVVETIERLGVREHVVFGGRVPQDPHNFVERAMLRDTPPEVADRRDWDQIRAWADSIAATLQGAPQVS